MYKRQPTYYDLKLFEFIDSLLKIQNIKEIIIHTNFSKPLDWWKLFADKYSEKPIEVNATCHLEYICSNKSLTEFTDKMVLLNNSGIKVLDVYKRQLQEMVIIIKHNAMLLHLYHLIARKDYYIV